MILTFVISQQKTIPAIRQLVEPCAAAMEPPSPIPGTSKLTPFLLLRNSPGPAWKSCGI